MKRLLCIVGKMDAGGAETFLMKVYRQLDKEKYQMDFAVADSSPGAYDQEILSMGGKIHHITPKSAGAYKNFTAIRDVVHENGYQYVMRISQHSLSALELLAAKLGGARVRVFRSSNTSTTSSSKVNQLLHKLCRFMPCAFANVRIAPSTEAAEFMFGKNCVAKGRAQIVHNAIDLSVYHYDPHGRSRIRDEFGIQDQVVVGHVGRFNHQKNHKFLLEIFHEFHKKNPNSILMLVGKGELEQEIREQIKTLGLEQSVILTGVRSDIPQLLSAMDVFLFPSFYEGMPNTVIEAQASGLPCVISDTITREADITGLVQYVPLNLSAEQWADTLSRTAAGPDRASFSAVLKSKGYDIQSVAAEACRILFGDSV